MNGPALTITLLIMLVFVLIIFLVGFVKKINKLNLELERIKEDNRFACHFFSNIDYPQVNEVLNWVAHAPQNHSGDPRRTSELLQIRDADYSTGNVEETDEIT